MKSLKDYLQDLNQDASGISPAPIQEVDDMRKMKINTQIDLDETEGLWNTTNDRWSRRAKHHISQTELRNATDTSEFAKGDLAVYEGQEVEIRIPLGPNGTAGVMLEGHLRMVDRTKLERIDETISGVMGGMKPLGPLNRIMQLAGLEHSGAVVEGEETLEEDAAGTMFDQLYQKNTQDPNYKNNPDAARVATVGQVLAGLQGVIGQLPQNMAPAVANQLKMIPGIGANLLAQAKAMTQPKAVGAPAGGAEE